jgi:predicted TIM-barrel fold metal-dependent hydrolase
MGLSLVPPVEDAPRRRVELGRVMIDNVDLDQAVARIDGFLHSAASHQIVTVNLDFLAVARNNPRFRETLNRASLAVADGMPLVWLSRLKGEPLPERVTGMTLVDECCRLAAQAGRGVFLLGAAPGVADSAAERLKERHPGLRIVMAETGIGWLPYLLDRMDESYEKFVDAKEYWDAHGGLRITMPPSQYFKRQVWATFQTDRPGLRLLDFLGADRVMWASDYPHADSTWPDSQKFIAEQFRDIDAAARQLGREIRVGHEDEVARALPFTEPALAVERARVAAQLEADVIARRRRHLRRGETDEARARNIEGR